MKHKEICECGETMTECGGGYVCESCGVFIASESLLDWLETSQADDVNRDLPRLVIRGRVGVKAPLYSYTHPFERGGGRVILDYLCYTYQVEKSFESVAIEQAAQMLEGSLPEMQIYRRDGGLHGYHESAVILIDSQNVGMVAAGGNRNTVYVSLTGYACYWLNPAHWADYLDIINARIARIDLAYDDFNGDISVRDVRRRYLDGQFYVRGQNPKSTAYGPWDDPLKKTGISYYVGSRQSGKMLRVYEKGRQLGDPESDWVRHEVEFKRIRSRELSPDMLRNMTAYYMGAYDYLKDLIIVDGVKPCKLDFKRVEMKITLDKLIHYCRQSYGRLIGYMSNDLDLVPGQVVKMLSREGKPARLTTITKSNEQQEVNKND